MTAELAYKFDDESLLFRPDDLPMSADRLMPPPDEVCDDYSWYPCGDAPELFYAPGQTERKTEKDAREAAAKALCNSCFARIVCLEHALEHGEDLGIWGGLNELERRSLLKKRSRL